MKLSDLTRQQKIAGALGIIAAITLFVVLIASVSAVTWPFNKVQTCSALNLTGSPCDQSWCMIQEGSWNVSNDLCVFYVNQTSTNTTSTLNESNYYNKTEIDAKDQNLSASIYELNRSLQNETFFNALQRNGEGQQQNSVQDSAPRDNFGLILFIVMLIAVILMIVIYLVGKKSGKGRGRPNYDSYEGHDDDEEEMYRSSPPVRQPMSAYPQDSYQPQQAPISEQPVSDDRQVPPRQRRTA